MADTNHGMNIAAGVEIRLQLHPDRIRSRYKIIQNTIGDLLMGDRAIAIAVDIQLDGFELNHPRAGLIDQTQHREIGITGKRALASELRQLDRHLIGPPRARIVEANKLGFSDSTLAVLGRLGLLLGR